MPCTSVPNESLDEETLYYSCDELKFRGFLVYNPLIKTKRPAVLVAHAWMGQDDFARQQARELAKLGYIGFALDLYGDGLELKNKEEAQKYMLDLFVHRQKLRARLLAAFEIIKNRPEVDPHLIGAIGFCFGGLAVMELLRTGVAIKGVVSFHGLLGHCVHGVNAQTVPSASQLKGALLILHGHDDPLVSEEDLRAVQQEFTVAKIDWQLHTFGQTSHAFTNPELLTNQNGLQFNSLSTARAMQLMQHFFEHLLKT